MSDVPPPMSPRDYLAFKRSVQANWGPFLAEGILLVVLGTAAMVVPVLASIAVSVVVGWVLLLGGLVGLGSTLLTRRTPGFWWSFFSAFITIIVGFLMIGWPFEGAVSLTLILTLFLITDGILTIMFAVDHRKSPNWAWMLLSGVFDLALAAAIVMAFPASATWALGLIVGVDLVFGGFALVTLALAARRGPRTRPWRRGSS